VNKKLNRQREAKNMTIARRTLLKAGGAAAAMIPTAGFFGALGDGKLAKIKFAFATKTVSPIVINIVIPEKLGYYAEEGISVECIPLGSNQAVMAGLDAKRVEFGVGVPSFQLPLVANGDKLPAVNFFEYTYPFKWAMAVKPNSPVKTLADLKGKKIGVTGFGLSEYPVGKAVLRLAGVDPEKDVTWLAVGEQTRAGQALDRGEIDALFYYDTGFGAIEAAGIKMRYVDLPNDVPKVGGLYLSTPRSTLKEHRNWAVGLARGVAKASLFIRTNPEAAAYTYLQMYPEAAPRGKSLEEQVNAILTPVLKRMPLYVSYDKTQRQWGRISPKEWLEEVQFAGLESKIKDTKIFYDNELIDEINKFDAPKIIAQAREFKLPYKK
jgi:NitT/TauT family transport system substrate-binding protein